MSRDLTAANIRVFLAGLPSKVYDKLSDAHLFDDEYEYNAVPYPTLQIAVSAASARTAGSCGSLAEL